jgi:hypothetical protein
MGFYLIDETSRLFVIRHETSDQFFIEPSQNPTNILVIDRLNHEFSLVDGRKHVPSTAKSRSIFGIVGTIRLLAGPYLVVITKCSKAGMVNGQDIWKVDETEIIPFARTILHLNEEQVKFCHL